MTARVVDADPIYQGDHVDAVVSVVNRLNQPVALTTGTLIDYEISQDDNSTAALVSKSVGSGITIRFPQTGANEGLFDLVILPADTAPLQGVLYHECVVDEGGKPRTIFAGKFPVKISPIK